MNPDPITTLTVDGLDIHNPDNGIWVSATNIWDMPEKEINEHEPVQSDGSIATYQRYRKRMFEINGKISTDTLENWLLKLNALQRKANSLLVNIVFGEGNAPAKTYPCIITKVNIDKSTLPNDCLFTITAWCGAPFALGDRVNSRDFTIRTSGIIPKRIDTVFYKNDHQHTSTANICPVITASIRNYQSSVPFTSVDTFLLIGNPNNGRFIKLQFNPNSTFATDIQANDVFRIDCLNKNIIRNGRIIYADGVLPFWDPADTDNVIRFECHNDGEFELVFRVSFQHRYL